MEMKELRKKLNSLENDYKNAKTTYRLEIKKLKRAQEQLQNETQAQEYAQKAAQDIQNRVHKKIAEIVSQCLSAVFDEPYDFKINFQRKRGKTEADLTFVRDGKERQPLSDSGGGQVDVASFALKIARLIYQKPEVRRTIVLDQPFKNVSKSKGYLDRIPGLLISLSEEFQIQFIIITHVEELMLGKIIDLEEK
jgi:DNA repair exonuclease SbcCD ATPase subunit